MSPHDRQIATVENYFLILVTPVSSLRIKHIVDKVISENNRQYGIWSYFHLLVLKAQLIWAHACENVFNTVDYSRLRLGSLKYPGKNALHTRQRGKFMKAVKKNCLSSCRFPLPEHCKIGERHQYSPRRGMRERLNVINMLLLARRCFSLLKVTFPSDF